MSKLFLGKWSRLLLVVTVLVLILGVTYTRSLIDVTKPPLPPAVPAVSVCKELPPGMRRIGERNGLQFDVPPKEFVIHEGSSDAPPLVYGFDVRRKDGKSLLKISYGLRADSVGVDPMRTFSSHVEKRNVSNDKGRPIGEDDWGYLNSGERWRQVRLSGGDAAQYDIVSEKEAKLFDQIINSACLSAAGPG